jgi:diguanylate cyclase (GGDEF)-like protein
VPSLRVRVFVLLGGVAIASIISIAAVFVATDTERTEIQAADERSAALQGEGDVLDAAIREQSEAIDDYLLSDDPASLIRYRQAVDAETVATEAIRQGVRGDAGLSDALERVATSASLWRKTFAQSAILAVLSDIPAELANVAKAAVNDQDEVQATVRDLVIKLDAVDVGLRLRSTDLNHTRALATWLGVSLQVLVLAVALLFVRRFGRRLEKDAVQANILNRFTEVTTFAAGDEEVARSNLEAIALLAAPDAAVTHVLNWSKDRAVPEATFGDVRATILPLHALSTCPGVVRGAVHVTDDASAPLSVHCPIYPTDHGTVACVPLAHGENVGAVHLFWTEPRAFPLELRAGVARITEHAALAIANRRLMAALKGQADTDARTGLRNSRAFDRALEDALAGRTADESLGVLMLDLDHFKEVNDRHGHPAGDEALRVFSGVLRSCMRDGDLAARYGGEEFAVLLSRVEGPTALQIAERIRTRTESTLISLAPGVTERLTVSIGLAMAPEQGIERIPLLRVADEALYSAKQGGRNRVGFLGSVRTSAAQVMVAEESTLGIA